MLYIISENEFTNYFSDVSSWLVKPTLVILDFVQQFFGSEREQNRQLLIKGIEHHEAI